MEILASMLVTMGDQQSVHKQGRTSNLSLQRSHWSLGAS